MAARPSALGRSASQDGDGRVSVTDDANWEHQVALGPADMPIAPTTGGEGSGRKRGRPAIAPTEPLPYANAVGDRWAELDPDNRNEAAWNALGPSRQHEIKRKGLYKKRVYVKRTAAAGGGSGPSSSSRSRGRQKSYTWKMYGEKWAKVDPARNTEERWNSFDVEGRRKIVEEAPWKQLPRRRRRRVVQHGSDSRGRLRRRSASSWPP